MSKVFDEDDDLAAQIAEANKGDYDNLDSGSTVKQGSKEWFKMRLGIFTGSKVSLLLTKGRSKDQEWGESAMKVIREAYMERDLTEEGTDLYIDEMYKKEFRQTAWGNKYESYAIDEFRAEYKEVVEEVGFTVHDEYKFFGGSFDGSLPLKNQIAEVKCPYDMLVHMDNCELDPAVGMPNTYKYYPQIQSNIEVAKADGCWFISFDPRRKSNRLHAVYVKRDDEFISKILNRVFIAEKAISYMNLGLNVADSILLATDDNRTKA